MSVERLTFFEFCERLKEDGAYIGPDGHMYSSKGKPLSRQAYNGYYTLRKNYDKISYCFMEHRVIWYFCNGAFDESLVINHLDCDRANNLITNLELVTQEENVQYAKSLGRLNPPKGVKSGKAVFTEDDVKLIRFLAKNGYMHKDIAEIFGQKWANTVSRVIRAERYGDVEDASDVWAVYPLLVEKTMRKDLPKDERIKDALLGLSGEVGEVEDMYKKYFYQGHELDEVHVLEELGDIMYYLTWLMIEAEINPADVYNENIRKLNARYPEGFDAERSINRTDR